MSGLKWTIKSTKGKILNNPDVKEYLNKLHDTFVLVPADKACCNIKVVRKKRYTETLLNELGINSSRNNTDSIYTHLLTLEKILKCPSEFMTSMGVGMAEKNTNLRYSY